MIEMNQKAIPATKVKRYVAQLETEIPLPEHQIARYAVDLLDVVESAEQIPLEENFRSSDGVVETARAFIEQNRVRLAKAMIPTGAQPYEIVGCSELFKVSSQPALQPSVVKNPRRDVICR